MHDIELLRACVGLSIIFLHPADDVRESVSCSVALVMSFFHHLEHQALKSPVIIEHSGNSLFTLLISNSVLYRNLQTCDDSRLGNNKDKLEDIFHLVNEFLSLNNNNNSSSFRVTRMICSQG